MDTNTDITDAAIEACNDAAMEPATMHNLVGVDCTISIGSDRYAEKVEKVTPKTITAGGKVFRWSAKYRAWRSGKHFWLHLGYAEDHRDPSF